MVWGCCETHQLPRDELKRFVKETPFTSREVLKLWSRYSRLDKDHTGRLSLQVPNFTRYLKIQCFQLKRPLCTSQELIIW